jgi:hypothetical protein
MVFMVVPNYIFLSECKFVRMSECKGVIE